MPLDRTPLIPHQDAGASAQALFLRGPVPTSPLPGDGSGTALPSSSLQLPLPLGRAPPTGDGPLTEARGLEVTRRRSSDDQHDAARTAAELDESSQHQGEAYRDVDELLLVEIDSCDLVTTEKN
ncbi:hypothetical protein OsJ_24254 [Oryza sativa Japonica Group]|uniref:Uncharacterized protein n=1 Tax=Oryza sativa subsp. japonica TaxID=39947 RepID=B9FX81_ORYSJ|nr:hypothetical protein OsJ_24254 [Oryza sativa Japonica Group]